jgi:hypothetical protein
MKYVPVVDDATAQNNPVPSAPAVGDQQTEFQ